jgi:cytochrome c oxidase assembly protein subunit 15
MLSTRRFALAVLVANLVVIVWGGFVRATGSGAGCGSHWPLCNGEVIPQARSIALLIELSHRVTSGVVVLLGVALVVACRRTYPAGHPARIASWCALGMVGVEALIGGFIVLARLVALDPSAAHGVAVGLHLISTFLLLSALAATVASTRGVDALDFRSQPRGLRIAALLPLASLLVVGSIGAINALGDTIYPATSLAAGIALDRADAAPLFVRLRIWHPILATVAVIVVFVCPPLVEKLRPSPLAKKASRAALILALTQWTLGLVNLSLLAPIPLQMLHLFVADLLWLSLSLVAIAAFSLPSPPAPTSRPAG